MAPRLIELCFQTAGLWELGAQSRFGLPQDVQQVSLLRAPELGGRKVVSPSSLPTRTTGASMPR